MPLSALWSSEPDSCGDSESSSTASGSSDQSSWFVRHQRTAKARKTRIRSAATRKLSKNAVLERPHPADRFKHDLHGDSEIHQPGQHSSVPRLRRLRLIVSYLKSWCAAVRQYFQSSTVDHSLVIAIVDDTNMRLSEVPSGSERWRIGRVVNVMNTIQKLVVSRRNETDRTKRENKTFNVITPLVVLPKADTETVAAEFQSRLLAFLGFVASRYHDLIPETLLQNVPIQGTVVMFDSLKVNVSMLKHLRQAVHEKHVASDPSDGSMHPLFATFCLLHQLALARTPILRAFSGFWSSVVRLSHLFENSSFRLQFRHSMVQVICDSFSFVAVPEIPGEASAWKHKRVSLVKYTDGSMKRISLHTDLMKWDNGDMDSTEMVHFCLGHCCRGSTQASKSWFALLQLTKYYTLLFGFGFPVPLLYRWTHAKRASQFVKDSGFMSIAQV